MSRSSLKRAFLLILAANIAVSVGCGNDQNKSRTKVSKRPINGRPSPSGAGGVAAHGAQDPQGARAGDAAMLTPEDSSAPAPGSQTNDGALPVQTSSEENRKTIETRKAIEQFEQLQLSGTALSVQQLENAEYTLENVAVVVNSIYSNSSPVEEVTGMFVGRIADRTIVQAETPRTAGLFVNEVDEGRHLIVPLSFKVAQPWTPARKGNDFSLFTQFAQGQMVVTPQSSEVARHLALMDLLAARPDGSGIYRKNDPNQVPVELKVLKTADGKVRFFISIEDEKNGRDKSRGGFISRKIILTYGVEATAAPAAEVVNGAAAPAAGQATQTSGLTVNVE